MIPANHIITGHYSRTTASDNFPKGPTMPTHPLDRWHDEVATELAKRDLNRRPPIVPIATRTVHASPIVLHRAAVEHYVMIVHVNGTVEDVLGEATDEDIAYEIEEAWCAMWEHFLGSSRLSHVGLNMDTLLRMAPGVRDRLLFGVR